MCKVLKPATGCAKTAALEFAGLGHTASTHSADVPVRHRYPDLAQLGQIEGVKAVSLMTAVPREIKEILKCTSAGDAAAAMKGLVDAVDPATVNMQSKYHDTFEKNKNRPYLKTTAWASGGGLPQFHENDCVYVFKDKRHTHFFADLFHTVEERISATISRNNLFHGHAVFDPGHQDLRIVFHAFEYPSDFDDTRYKSEAALLVEDTVKPFESGQVNFSRRNVIWTLGSHRLLIPDYKILGCSGLFGSLLVAKNDSYPNLYVVEQGQVGVELVAFNYFPKELDSSLALFLES